MTTRPLLVVGWDAAGSDLVRSLLDAGRLPTLASLLDGRDLVDVEGLAGTGDDTHWTTFTTGVGPGEHGRFHFVQRPHGTRVMRATPHVVEAFWGRLARAGTTVSVLDVPKAQSVGEQNAREVLNWLAHTATRGEPVASPGELAPSGGWPEQHTYDDVCNTDLSEERASKEHVERVDRRRELQTELLEGWVRDPTDVTIAVYSAVHCVGHHFWDCHEPVDAVSSTRRDRLGDPVVAQLEAVDRDLGRLLDAASPAPRVAVLSLTAMGSMRDASAIVESVVDQLERRWRRQNRAIGRLATAVDFAHRLRHGPDRGSSVARVFAPIDHRFGGATAIRLGVRGRDRFGVLPPQRRRQVIDELAAELESLASVDGDPVLSDVMVVEDRYPGSRHDVHADLLAVWATNSPRAATTTSIRIDGITPPAGRSGDHRTGGWLAVDPSLPIPTEPVAITDFASLVDRWVKS